MASANDYPKGCGKEEASDDEQVSSDGGCFGGDDVKEFSPQNASPSTRAKAIVYGANDWDTFQVNVWKRKWSPSTVQGDPLTTNWVQRTRMSTL